MAVNQGSVRAAEGDARLMAILGYGLFLIGWPCLHVSTIAGLILAYIKRDDARGTIWESHFTNLIRTFWISLVLGIAAAPLIFAGVGVLLEGLVVLWFLYRTIKGLIRAIEHRPYYG